jgi:hypothetical protein
MMIALLNRCVLALHLFLRYGRPRGRFPLLPRKMNGRNSQAYVDHQVPDAVQPAKTHKSRGYFLLSFIFSSVKVSIELPGGYISQIHYINLKSFQEVGKRS